MKIKMLKKIFSIALPVAVVGTAIPLSLQTNATNNQTTSSSVVKTSLNSSTVSSSTPSWNNTTLPNGMVIDSANTATISLTNSGFGQTKINNASNSKEVVSHLHAASVNRTTKNLVGEIMTHINLNGYTFNWKSDSIPFTINDNNGTVFFSLKFVKNNSTYWFNIHVNGLGTSGKTVSPSWKNYEIPKGLKVTNNNATITLTNENFANTGLNNGSTYSDLVNQISLMSKNNRNNIITEMASHLNFGSYSFDWKSVPVKQTSSTSALFSFKLTNGKTVLWYNVYVNGLNTKVTTPYWKNTNLLPGMKIVGNSMEINLTANKLGNTGINNQSTVREINSHISVAKMNKGNSKNLVSLVANYINFNGYSYDYTTASTPSSTKDNKSMLFSYKLVKNGSVYWLNVNVNGLAGW